MIRYLNTSLNISLENFHCIGYNLGAHVCGYTGTSLASKYGSKLNRITGLDPAGPLFDHNDTSERLDKTDAIHVDVIHTDEPGDYYLCTAESAPFGLDDELGLCTYTSNRSTHAILLVVMVLLILVIIATLSALLYYIGLFFYWAVAYEAPNLNDAIVSTLVQVKRISYATKQRETHEAVMKKMSE
ncbi:hypothetical protein B566_EDAN013336 [Ephemera danica]|nr:hypothetical protein B566_EDAN013336 [Ephemera danica]